MHTILLLNENEQIDVQLKVKTDKALERITADGKKLTIDLNNILIVKDKGTVIKKNESNRTRKPKPKAKSKSDSGDSNKPLDDDRPVLPVR